MPKFRRKPLEVDAVVFSGEDDLPAGVIRDDAGFFVMITQRPRRSITLYDGDWIVTEPSGKQRVMGPEAFAAEFEAVGNETPNK